MCVAQDQSFEMAKKDTDTETYMWSWEVALNDESPLCSRDETASAEDEASNEYESRLTKSRHKEMDTSRQER